MASSFRRKYDVFLSFRGEDTRENITSHLYAALCRRKIETYIDYRLERGDEISKALLKAIRESKISVIIFSENYASSSWCLDELVEILKCRKNHKQIVIPIFYRIDPSSVRKQEGTYASAFRKLERRFRDKIVKRWKVALTEAANLSGWDSQKIRYDLIRSMPFSCSTSLYIYIYIWKVESVGFDNLRFEYGCFALIHA